MKSRPSRPVIRRVNCINVVVLKSLEFRIQPLSFTTVDNLAVFVFKESQNTAFIFFVLKVIGITIEIAGVSILDSNYSKLNCIVLLPLPVFYIGIVRLIEGNLWGIESRSMLNIGTRVRWWFGIQHFDQLHLVCKIKAIYG